MEKEKENTFKASPKPNQPWSFPKESLRSTAGKGDDTYASQIMFRKHHRADLRPSSRPKEDSQDLTVNT